MLAVLSAVKVASVLEVIQNILCLLLISSAILYCCILFRNLDLVYEAISGQATKNNRLWIERGNKTCYVFQVSRVVTILLLQ